MEIMTPRGVCSLPTLPAATPDVHTTHITTPDVHTTHTTTPDVHTTHTTTPGVHTTHINSTAYVAFIAIPWLPMSPAGITPGLPEYKAMDSGSSRETGLLRQGFLTTTSRKRSTEITGVRVKWNQIRS